MGSHPGVNAPWLFDVSGGHLLRMTPNPLYLPVLSVTRGRDLTSPGLSASEGNTVVLSTVHNLPSNLVSDRRPQLTSEAFGH